MKSPHAFLAGVVAASHGLFDASPRLNHAKQLLLRLLDICELNPKGIRYYIGAGRSNSLRSAFRRVSARLWRISARICAYAHPLAYKFGAKRARSLVQSLCCTSTNFAQPQHIK